MEAVKKICNFVSTVLVAMVVILAILLVGVRIFGIEVYTVLSGSMEPVYHTGSVIYVKDVDDPAALEKDTVITFHIGENTIATHRIIEVVEENGEVAYRTKGDANDIEDGGLVNPGRIIGTPVFTIPYLGYLVSVIQSPSGRMFSIAAVAFIFLIGMIPDMLSEEKDSKKDKKKDKKEETKEN